MKLFGKGCLYSIIMYLRKSGDLVYENHANFGFKDVVDFLKKQELPDTFLKQLNCERAEEKDPFEIVKVNFDNNELGLSFCLNC